MPEKKPCPLCGTKCDVESIPAADHDTIDCPVCGKYNLTGRAKEHLNSRKDSFYIISGVTRNYYERNQSGFTITYKMICEDSEFEAKILSQEPKTVLGKAELLLQYLHRESNYPGDVVSITLSQDYPLCFCKNADELWFHAKYLKEIGVIEGEVFMNDPSSLSLTAEGWQEIESMTKPNIESKQAFVAMWFDESMDAIFDNGILPLEDKNETGFKMFRVDKTQFNDEKICDRIITEIKKSRFLIADVTEHRQAVYFEAGYAMGMGIPVIWTCREEKKYTDSCCFDTRQYPHIFWRDTDDLKTRLKEKILATIGKA